LVSVAASVSIISIDSHLSIRGEITMGAIARQRAPGTLALGVPIKGTVPETSITAVRGANLLVRGRGSKNFFCH